MSTTLSARISFIESIYSSASNISNSTGISLDFILSQTAHETDWGSKVLPGTNNLFNIKADSSWSGDSKTFSVREYINGKWVTVESSFRVYTNYEQSINDWLTYLQNNPRYSHVFDNDVKGDLSKIAQAIKDAGYATDPNYAQRIKDISTCRSMKKAIVEARKKQSNKFRVFDKYVFGHKHLLGDLSKSFFSAEGTKSPLVLDLDGNGIVTTSIAGNAYFDHNGNGLAEKTGWVGEGEGLLVRDINGDGQINNGSELFGSETRLANGQKAANGYAALAELDKNHDGVINSQDAAYSTLKIWKDTDGDGESNVDELLMLEEAGVQSISVSYNNTNIADENGNQIKQTSTFTRTRRYRVYHVIYADDRTIELL